MREAAAGAIDQQVDEGIVSIAEFEERFVDSSPIFAAVVLDLAAAKDLAVGADGGFQLRLGQRLARFVFRKRSRPIPLAGDEKPLLGDAAALHGAKRAS